MFSARNREQENVVHAHQTAGVVKANALGAKTPGPSNTGKTPARKVPLYDENTTRQAGKSKVAGKQSFQTPVARDRAPLGAKTTNAKAKPFATPAAPLTGAKQNLQASQLKTPATNKQSARRNKLRIHHSPEIFQGDDPLGVSQKQNVESKQEDLNDIDDDSEPEVEYCPPRPVDLPDYPDPDDPFEFKPDETFPMLKPQNIMKGTYQTFVNPRGKDGLTLLQRRAQEEEEELQRHIEGQEHQLTAQVNASLDAIIGRNPVQATGEVMQTERTGARPGPSRIPSSALDRDPPSSHVSKAAAVALASNNPNATAQLPNSNMRAANAAKSFAAPTASSRAKRGTIAVDKTAASSYLAHSRTRSTDYYGASRSTIGRAKGRQVSAELRGDKPKMADRMRPQMPLSVAEEQQRLRKMDEEADEKSMRMIDKMLRDFEEEEEKKRGIRGGVDDLGQQALDEALNQNMGKVEDEDFQLDMPDDL